jgi:hypothetical protein
MSRERDLITAVLVQAIKDYLSKNMALRKQAEHWFERQGEEPFSFPWCCRQLDVDPSRTLGKIRGMTMGSFKKMNRNKEAAA